MDDCNNDEELMRLERQLRIEQLKAQIAQHRASRLLERLPELAETFMLFCAGAAVTLILVVAVATVLKRLAA
jgi:hypothetical protein